MSAISLSPARRHFLAASAAAGAATMFPAAPQASGEDDAIRPFRVSTPDASTSCDSEIARAGLEDR